MDLLCAKVAQTGDLRKAFQIIKMITKDKGKENQISAIQMIQLLKSAFGSQMVNQIKKASLHQKLVLCGIYHLPDPSKAMTINIICEGYKNACASKISILANNEFLEVLEALDASGVIQRQKRKNEVIFDVMATPSELKAGLADFPFFAT